MGDQDGVRRSGNVLRIDQLEPGGIRLRFEAPLSVDISGNPGGGMPMVVLRPERGQKVIAGTSDQLSACRAIWWMRPLKIRR